MDPNTQLTRREFLRISEKVIEAAVLGPKLGSLSVEEPTTEVTDIDQNNKELASNLDIDIPITNIEVQEFRTIFSNLAQGVEDLRKNPINLIDEEKYILETFNPPNFLYRADQFVNKAIRLQNIYNQYQINVDLDPHLKNLILDIIRHDFASISMPLELFRKHGQPGNNSPETLARRLFFDTIPMQGRVPVDPLIGMNIYSDTGMQTWFKDFDYRFVEGETERVYPITHKFIKNSGILFTEIVHTLNGTNVNGSDSNLRPEPLLLQAEKSDFINNEYTYREIEIDAEAQELLFEDLAKIGIDRASSRLAVRNNDNNNNAGGFVSVEGEPNVLLPFSRIDKETYLNNRSKILVPVTHELFHTLLRKLPLLSDHDAYFVHGVLIQLFKTVNPIFSKKEILNDSNLNLHPNLSFFDFLGGVRLQRMNESFRNSYINQIMITDAHQQFDMVNDMFSMELFPNSGEWQSKLMDKKYEITDWENKSPEEKNRIGHQLEQRFIDDIREILRSQEPITNFERFILQEILQRAESGSIYSELSVYTFKISPSQWYTRTLPSLMMYSAIVRGDWKCINAISMDLDEAVKAGRIDENMKLFLVRKLGWMIKHIQEQNGATFSLRVNPINEYSADQFSLGSSGESGHDWSNSVSSIKSRKTISKIAPILQDVLKLFRDKNLAMDNSPITAV